MRFRFGSLAFLAVLAGGCVVDGASEDELEATAEDGTQEAVPDEGALGMASQALAHTGEVYWTQGSPDIGLGPIKDRICFLTGIRGNFAGMAESVRVYRSGEDPDTDSWYLGGTSAQTGVAAWAACAYAPQTSQSAYYSLIRGISRVSRRQRCGRARASSESSHRLTYPTPPAPAADPA